MRIWDTEKLSFAANLTFTTIDYFCTIGWIWHFLQMSEEMLQSHRVSLQFWRNIEFKENLWIQQEKYLSLLRRKHDVEYKEESENKLKNELSFYFQIVCFWLRIFLIGSFSFYNYVFFLIDLNFGTNFLFLMIHQCEILNKNFVQTQLNNLSQSFHDNCALNREHKWNNH